jgi:hypothetical protein
MIPIGGELHLTSRANRLLVFDAVVYAPNLDEFQGFIASDLGARAGGAVSGTRLDRHLNRTIGTTLDDSYFRMALPLIQEQLAKAGVRIAWMLNGIFR